MLGCTRPNDRADRKPDHRTNHSANLAATILSADRPANDQPQHISDLVGPNNHPNFSPKHITQRRPGHIEPLLSIFMWQCIAHIQLCVYI